MLDPLPQDLGALRLGARGKRKIFVQQDKESIAQSEARAGARVQFHNRGPDYVWESSGVYLASKSLQ